MVKLIAAYNNDASCDVADVFQLCAEEVKKICLKYGVEFQQITPPGLTNDRIRKTFPCIQILFVAAHGTNDAILNEKNEDLLSTHTINYDLKGKGVYTVSCYAANSLSVELQRIGVRLYVGYDDEFWVSVDYMAPFCKSAVAGLDSFLSGDTVAVARQKMLDTFDKQIEELSKLSNLAADFLSHDKVHLCFEGDDLLTIDMLK